MSWARWVSGSDVYVFEDVSGGVTCCGCSLAGDFADFNTNNEAELIEHFKAHQAAGHVVPDKVWERLAEWSAEGCP